MTSIEKSLYILDLFLNIEGDISLSELTKLAGLDKTTVNRIVAVLIRYGYLRQKERKGKYSLGWKFLDFSGIIKKRSVIRDIAVKHLTNLSNAVQESTILSFWDGESGIYGEIFNWDYPVKIITADRSHIPVHCTGVGKIFLTQLSDEELDKVLNKEPLKKYTTNTITDPDKLKEEIRKISKTGVSFDYEEYHDGLTNVASPIKDSFGNIVGAIGLIGISVRLNPERMKALVPDVKNCARDISEDLVYRVEKKEI